MLYDNIIALEKLPVPVIFHWEEIRAHLRKAVVISSDDVARYYYAGTDQEYWDVNFPNNISDIKMFPNIAPPFPLMWIEYTVPAESKYKSEIRPNPDRNCFRKVGVFFCSQKVSNGWKTAVYIFGECFSHDGTTGHFAALPGVIKLEMSREGLVDDSSIIFDGKHLMENVNPETTKDFHFALLHPALLTICFLHCKNVELSEYDPPEKLQKKRAKGGKLPLTKFHTLTIEPMKKILRTEGNSERTGIKMALHICRGHFKDFTIGKGLFGKYHGLYWWEMAVRGSSEYGTIKKGYKVNLEIVP